MREAGVGDDDATEGDDKEKEEWHVEGCEQLIGAEGGDGLAEADIEELKHADHEENIAGCEALRESCAPVPAAPVDCAGQKAVGDFGEDGTDDERDPAVDFGV